MSLAAPEMAAQMRKLVQESIEDDTFVVHPGSNETPAIKPSPLCGSARATCTPGESERDPAADTHDSTPHQNPSLTDARNSLVLPSFVGRFPAAIRSYLYWRLLDVTRLRALQVTPPWRCRRNPPPQCRPGQAVCLPGDRMRAGRALTACRGCVAGLQRAQLAQTVGARVDLGGVG